MSSYSKECEELLGAVRIGIDNTRQSPIIKEKMSELGYEDAALENAWNKNVQLENKYKECQRKHGEQLEASQAMYAKMEIEITRYMDLRKLAKRALRGDEYRGTREKLGIDDELKRAIEGFLDQSSKFYKHAGVDQSIMERLATFKITAAKLQEALTELNSLKTLISVQEAKKGEAQVARQERDDLFMELQKWYSDFKQAARIEFKDMPEYLVIMGIPLYSEIRKKTEPEPPAPPVPPLPPAALASTGTTAVQNGQNTQDMLNQTVTPQAIPAAPAAK